VRWLSCMHVPPISIGMSTTTPGAGASQGSNAPVLKKDPVPPVTLGRPDRSLGRRRRLIRGAGGPAVTRVRAEPCLQICPSPPTFGANDRFSRGKTSLTIHMG
jgi:hypothetical protein